MGHFLCLKCPGRFWWGTKGFHTEIGFPHVGTPFRFPYIRLELANFATSRSLALAFLVISYITGMAAFTSTISIPAAQLADAPQLEPAFEHLLRNSSVHESAIRTLRVNAITDRDTFVNMFDSEAALKRRRIRPRIRSEHGGAYRTSVSLRAWLLPGNRKSYV